MKIDEDDLEYIPGIGPKISRELKALGFRDTRDLRNQDPEVMYQDLRKLRKKHIDRCVLYVFRCAVYYANNKMPDPELLKWWRWKDKK